MNKANIMKFSIAFTIIIILSITIINECTSVASNEGSICSIIDKNLSWFVLTQNNFYLPMKLMQYNEEENIVVGYNQMHSLDIWDMIKKQPLYKVNLIKDGPRRILEIKSFYYHNQDTIICLSDFEIVLINSKSEILKTIKINSPRSDLLGINFDSLQIFNDPNNRNPIYYARNSIFVSLKEFDNDFIHYNHPIIGRINIVTNEIRTLPIKHPQQYKNNSYGFLDKPNVIYFKDRIIVNFPISNIIYIYNLDGDLIKEVSPIGKYTSLKSQPLPQSFIGNEQNLLAHLESNPQYYPVMYFPDSKSYLRIHRPARVMDKELYYLTLLDENLNILEEQALSRANMTLASLFYDHQSIYIHYWGEQEDSISYQTYTINCK